MAPRSVWNLGLRPQPARPLAGSRHSRAISLAPIGRCSRQSRLKPPHEPAASAPASFQRDLPAEWGRGSGGVERERGGPQEREVGRRAEPSREPREAAWRIGSSELSIKRSPPPLPFPLPPLPLPVRSPQAQPFRLAHWLGAFGDGEGGAPLRSWWRREFERGARRLRSAFPARWPAPGCSRQAAGASGGGCAPKREGTPGGFLVEDGVVAGRPVVAPSPSSSP
ncbi:uncharacterized protein LOC135228692 [Loxodonta africana]|uniref:uncharacterized protein LOC135228692 n=1 Tax=Loxodonta africana TaxID=9785 RepID=UPI0030CAAE0C